MHNMGEVAASPALQSDKMSDLYCYHARFYDALGGRFVSEDRIDSLSITQEGRDNTRIAATVEYGQDKEWLFIRRVHDQKISYGMKTQRPRCQIGAAVAHLWEGDEGANRFIDFLKNTASCAGIVGGDIFPDFI